MIHRGDSPAFSSGLLTYLQANSDIGYQFYPNSNKTIKAQHIIVDDELALNIDKQHGSDLHSAVWNGPWMPFIKSKLAAPKLMSVEMHMNGATTKGATHRDHHYEEIWIVIVPLEKHGNISGTSGGTVVINDAGVTDTINCNYNSFAVFPAHFKHYRQASSTQLLAQQRRSLFMLFSNIYKLPVEFMSSGRRMHTRQKLKQAGVHAIRKVSESTSEKRHTRSSLRKQSKQA